MGVDGTLVEWISFDLEFSGEPEFDVPHTQLSEIPILLEPHPIGPVPQLIVESVLLNLSPNSVQP